MNKIIDFSKLGGYPLAQEDLDWLQSSYRPAFGELSKLIGDKVIISGMTEGGGNVTNGWISINGELLPFIGGAIGTGECIIEETKQSLTFQNAQVNEVLVTRVARFGSPGTFMYADLVRPTTIKEIWQPGDLKLCQLTMEYIVANFDVTGKGINLRKGWVVCNGQNGTVNMADKLPLGYNWENIAGVVDAVGDAKGSASIAKTNLPAVGIGYRDRYHAEVNGALGGATNKETMPANYNNKRGSNGSDADNDTFLYIDATTSNLGNGTAYYPSSIITLYLKKV